MGKFTDAPKTFIQRLKKNGLLDKVTDLFIDMLPEKISGEINYDEINKPDENYWIFFYLETKLKPLNPTQTYLNRDINIDEEDGQVEFSITLQREGVVQTSPKEIIFFC